MNSILKSKKVKLVAAIMILVVISITMGTVTMGYESRKLTEKLELGERYLASLEYEEAIIAFEEVIEIEPKIVRAYVGIAEANINLERTEEAITVLESGIAIVTNCKNEEGIVLEHAEELYIKAADIFIQQGDVEKAADILTEGYNLTESEEIKEMKEPLAPIVNFNLTEGEYDSVQELELSSEGIEIYYTVNGSEPTEESSVYKEPIVLKGGERTIKAVARSSYGIFGDITKATYHINIPLPELTDNEIGTLDQIIKNMEAKKIVDTYPLMINEYKDFVGKNIEELPLTYDSNGLSRKNEGLGLQIISHDRLYYGELKNGQPDGRGIMLWSFRLTWLDWVKTNGYFYYSGDWVSGKPNGKGESGRFIMDDMEQLERKIWEDFHPLAPQLTLSSVTIGEYKNGLENGQMTLTTKQEYPGNDYYRYNEEHFSEYKYTAKDGIVQSSVYTNYDNAEDIGVGLLIKGENTDIYSQKLWILFESVRATLDYSEVCILGSNAEVLFDYRITIE